MAYRCNTTSLTKPYKLCNYSCMNFGIIVLLAENRGRTAQTHRAYGILQSQQLNYFFMEYYAYMLHAVAQ